MNEENHISTLFLDIGGVLLSDGWDRKSRQAAAQLFHLNHHEMEEMHHLNCETLELGKMSLDTYLTRVVFYQPRNFSVDEFKTFMYQQSSPYPKMIPLFIQLKKEYRLKVAVVSNEGRELNAYRIEKFKLNSFIDFFISSSFVKLRKPDADIFSMALDISQASKSEILYIDNQPMFVQIAEEFGIKGIIHKDYNSTLVKLQTFGLTLKKVNHG